MGTRLRTYGPLALAASLHALLLAGMWSVVRVEVRGVVSMAGVADVEVDLVQETHRSRAVSEPSVRQSLTAPAPLDSPHAARVSEGSLARVEPSPSVPPLPVTEERGSWTLQVTNVDIGVGIAAHPSQVHIGPGRSSSDTTAGARSNTGGVSEALAEHDVSMGLGRGGMVRGAVEGALQASTLMGNATFEIRIDAGGSVRVNVADVSGNRALWARLSDAIADEVRAKRGQVRMPPGGHGLEVVVRAEAIDRLVDGRKASSLGNHIETSGGVTETEHQIVVTPPGVTLKHEGKVCSAGIHVGADKIFVVQSAGNVNSVDSAALNVMPISIGGGCSPETIGTVPIRMVAARIVSESAL